MAYNLLDDFGISKIAIYLIYIILKRNKQMYFWGKNKSEVHYRWLQIPRNFHSTSTLKQTFLVSYIEHSLQYAPTLIKYSTNTTNEGGYYKDSSWERMITLWTSSNIYHYRISWWKERTTLRLRTSWWKHDLNAHQVLTLGHHGM